MTRRWRPTSFSSALRRITRSWAAAACLRLRLWSPSMGDRRPFVRLPCAYASIDCVAQLSANAFVSGSQDGSP